MRTDKKKVSWANQLVDLLLWGDLPRHEKIKRYREEEGERVTLLLQSTMSTQDTSSIVGSKRPAPEEQNAAGAAVWQKCFSNTHKKNYWFCADTGERRWEEPPAAVVVAATQVADNVSVPNASSSSSSSSCLPPGWTKHTSTKHGRDYWYHAITKETRWEPPLSVPTTSIVSTSAAAAAPKKNFEELLEKEQREAAMDRRDCPRVINSTDLPLLVQRLRRERAEKRPGTGTEFAVIFEIANDELAEFTRAVQEDQILKTRLKLRRGKDVVDLPSFWEVWDTNPTFRHRIQSSSDPNEEKWKCRKDFGYKIATTFMPLYAKAVYEHFGAERVLDPWYVTPYVSSLSFEITYTLYTLSHTFISL